MRLRFFQCLGKSRLFIINRKENLGEADGSCAWRGASRAQRHVDMLEVSGLFPRGVRKGCS